MNGYNVFCVFFLLLESNGPHFFWGGLCSQQKPTRNTHAPKAPNCSSFKAIVPLLELNLNVPLSFSVRCIDLYIKKR